MNYDDEGYCYPTVEEDAWFQHHVVSRDYPKVKRDKPMIGQLSFVTRVDGNGHVESQDVLIIEPRDDGIYVNGKKML